MLLIYSSDLSCGQYCCLGVVSTPTQQNVIFSHKQCKLCPLLQDYILRIMLIVSTIKIVACLCSCFQYYNTMCCLSFRLCPLLQHQMLLIFFSNSTMQCYAFLRVVSTITTLCAACLRNCFQNQNTYAYLVGSILSCVHF